MNEILNSNDFLLALDITATIVGLVYIWLEYRASIYLWIAGIIMPAIDIFLYYEAGLYADFGMAIYYTLAALYGHGIVVDAHVAVLDDDILDYVEVDGVCAGCLDGLSG